MKTARNKGSGPFKIMEEAGQAPGGPDYFARYFSRFSPLRSSDFSHFGVGPRPV
jgi:hypothetical protein